MPFEVVSNYLGDKAAVIEDTRKTEGERRTEKEKGREKGKGREGI